KPAHILAHRFWPGPLTIVMPAWESVSAALTAGTGHIGIRWPQAVFANRLVSDLGKPVTATSANRSGMPAAATAAGVRTQFEGPLELVIDGGRLPAPGGSTVIDVTSEPAVVLREGPIGFEELRQTLEGCCQRGYGRTLGPEK